MKYFLTLLSTFLLAMAVCPQSIAQSDSEFPYGYPPLQYTPPVIKSSAGPYLTFRVHDNGLFRNTVLNNGIIGNIFGYSNPNSGTYAPSYFFPGLNRVRHGMYTGLWIGGIKGTDTLVSTSVDHVYYWWRGFRGEMWPSTYDRDGDMKEAESQFEYSNLGSASQGQLEYEAVFTDTFTAEQYAPYSSYDRRNHQALGIKVWQKTYTWSYRYAEDIMLVDYRIGNISRDTIHKAYIGLYHVGANHHIGELPYPRLDDLEGYIRTYPSDFPQLPDEELGMAWTCDYNGLPNGASWGIFSTRNAFGIAPLRVPEGADVANFNWWTTSWAAPSPWGPRKTRTMNWHWRDFATGGAAPVSDKDKYYCLAKPEVDYSGYEAAIDYTMLDWVEKSPNAEEIADGHYVQMLLSYGPFTLAPNETTNLTVVMAIGQDVHTVPTAFEDMYSYTDPGPFMRYLNFDDLVNNFRWGKRIYDNPGVDTDNDGDSGKYFFLTDSITGDSTQVFYEGDGVPDFRGAQPPPPPKVRVSTESGKVTVRWNGREVENFFDTFSGVRDFEGYRVYIARSQDQGDQVILASYDLEDYSRFKYSRVRRRYENTELPFTLDQLHAIYGDDFEPMYYTRYNPLRLTPPGSQWEEAYYFDKVDFNHSPLDNPKGIHRIYPEAAKDTSDVDEEGRMRYYEYECVVDNLLESVPYYISVTAFDFGHPAKSLDPLESSALASQVRFYATAKGEEIFAEGDSAKGLDVYVYPNPYRIDGDYIANGFEGRLSDLPHYRTQRIQFGNLPNKCSISIYTIDGDLVVQLEHDKPEGSGTSTIAEWDLITRNTQAIVSGLYYWVVESEYGNQIGKLAIVK